MAANASDKFTKSAVRFTTTIGAGGVADAAVTTIPLSTTTNLPTDTAIFASIDRVDADGNKTLSKWEVVKGVVSGSNLTTSIRGVEGTAQAHTAGAVVEIILTSSQWDDLVDGILEEHNQNGTHDNTKVAMLAGAQTFTGAKTFSTAPLFTFGTEASGDIFYGSADGTITRLPKGTDGQILTLASGVPSWVTATSSNEMTTGTQKGALGSVDTAGAESGPLFICRQNSASNRFVSVQVNFPIPFTNTTGLSVTISDETVFAPSSNTNRASGATKGTDLITNADGKCVGFLRRYQDNTNFTVNGGHLIRFDWSATRT